MPAAAAQPKETAGPDGELPEEREVIKLRRLESKGDLARGLLALSDALAAHGRPDEALEAADEAVDLCEALVERFGASYRSTAGWAAYTLGSRLSELGRGADAVVLHAEAVETFRNVHRHDPYQRGKHLGVALSGYAAPLLALGRFAEAVTAAEEALALLPRSLGRGEGARVPAAPGASAVKAVG